MKKIILASASPRRQMLLEQAGIPFDVIESNIDESVSTEISPYDTVKSLSTKKAMSVFERITEPAVIIAADTVVSLNGRVLNKPESQQDAFDMLRKLNGQKHSVYTGVSVINKDENGYEMKNFVDTTGVTMRKLTTDEIWAYIKTGEPFDKAGAYAIQGKGSLLVDSVEGDYYTVVGLPLVKIYAVLKDFGIDMLQQSAN